MRPLGLILIVVGILMLAFQGFTYTTERTVIDAGPLQAKIDEKKTIPPWVGGVAVVVGLALVLADRRRPT